ncbi:MAG TPA: PDZ domain-containing protein [Kangiella sp.]
MLMKSTLLSACLLVSLSASAQTNELKSAEAQILADNLKREISRTLAEINRLESKQDSTTESLSLVLSEPAYQSISFGVVIDPDSNTVLSVTPHSNAEALGLKAGDVIKELSVDGVVVKKIADGLKLKSASSIEAQIRRGDRTIPLNAIAQSNLIPAWSLQVSSNKSAQNEPELAGCGYLSVFFTPPGTKYQYSAKVFEVDGETGFHYRDTIKLPSGPHSIIVHEYIPDGMMSRRKPGIEKGKTLELTIEPNKTYHIAAQFDPKKRLKVVDEDYWKPIVWKVSDSKCKP